MFPNARVLETGRGLKVILGWDTRIFVGPKSDGRGLHTHSLFVWLVCWWLVLVRSERKVLLAGCWWLVCLREKYCWLVADKPNEQGVRWLVCIWIRTFNIRTISKSLYSSFKDPNRMSQYSTHIDCVRVKIQKHNYLYLSPYVFTRTGAISIQTSSQKSRFKCVLCLK
jgi:hypothetical protein